MARDFELRGYDHAKAVLSDPAIFEKKLQAFGFQRYTGALPASLENPLSVWGSGDAVFALYASTHPFAKPHHALHGDTIFDLSFVVESFTEHPMFFEGAGQMRHTLYNKRNFKTFLSPKGILRFDHNTLNVERGTMDPMVSEYLKTFGFEKGQFFNIRGKETALYSQVTRSKDHSVQIPFNESADGKSQIEEYIVNHRGAGVQHLALITTDVMKTISDVRKDPACDFKFLDITDTYYEVVSKKVKIRESIEDLKRLRIQVDQDKDGGYLLQIFTENMFGSFFFEIIQREGATGFGEGNFQTLFEAMEIDQKRRGVL